MDEYRFPRRYYRILTEQASERRHLSSERTPEKMTEQIIRGGKFVYIDSHATYLESGLKPMEQIDIDDVELDAENIGRNVICSLQNTSPENQKTVDYIHRANDMRKQREKYNTLMKRKRQIIQTERKLQEKRKLKSYQKARLKKKKQTQPSSINFLTEQEIKREQKQELMRKKAFVSLVSHRQEKKKVVESVQETLIKRIRSENTQILYHGMKANKLKQYLQNKEMERVNSKILEKEMELIRNFGLMGEEQLLQKKDNKILVKKRRKNQFLPALKSVSKSHGNSNIDFS